MDFLETLRSLSRISAPAGFESPTTRAAQALIEPFVDECEIDTLGNLLGIKRSARGDALRLMVDAHLDRIGFLATGVDGGFVRFRALGGLDARLLSGVEITWLTEPRVTGVVAVLPPHLRDRKTENKVVPVEDLLCDIGCSNDEVAARRVPPGTPGLIEMPPMMLGDKQITGAALDNLAGFAVLIRLLEKLNDVKLPLDIVICGSVQEELGLRGAAAAARNARADACVVVDATFGHTPGTDRERTFALGGGPCIGIGPDCRRSMSQALKQVAFECGIPSQLEVMAGSADTNAWVVQTVRNGIPAAVLSYPLKSMHSAVETVAVSDLETTADLLFCYILSLDGEVF